jgi:hypothetical protein
MRQHQQRVWCPQRGYEEAAAGDPGQGFYHENSGPFAGLYKIAGVQEQMIGSHASQYAGGVKNRFRNAVRVFTTCQEVHREVPVRL